MNAVCISVAATSASLAAKRYNEDVGAEVLNQQEFDAEEKRMNEIRGLVLLVCLCLMLLVLTSDLEIFPETESELLDTWVGWSTNIKAN